MIVFGKVVLGGILLGAAGTDLSGRRIPNRLIAVGLGMFFVLALWLSLQNENVLLIGCLQAGVLAFVIHLIPYLLKSMGAGDVKLALIMGLLSGWEDWLGYMGVYCAFSLITSVALLCLRKGRQKTLPLAPVMAAAFLFYHFACYI